MSGAPRQAQAASASRPEQDRERSIAEWVTLGISIAVVLAVVGLISLFSLRGGNAPPAIAVEPRMDALRHDEGGFYLPVVVRNEGDRTAEDVVVSAELDAGEHPTETADFTITFLAGGDEVEGTFVFRSDPARGDLTVRVVSFLEP